ncbi:MAG: 50S ribosomal protein L15 [Candidatus Limnocylindria bacterium]
MKLHDLRPTPGSRPTSRRVGRGHGSGRGKTAGRGTKGQKSRAGGKIPAWFEGGQTPIHIRTPKLHGFRNRGRVAYAPINLARLSDVPSGTLVTPDVLVHDGLLHDTKLPLKILGNGDAPKGITINAHAFSRTAADKLAAAGSTAKLISWPDNGPIDEEALAATAEATAAKNRTRQAKRRKGNKGNQTEAPAAAASDQASDAGEAGASSDDTEAPESPEAAAEGESEPGA